MSEGKRRWMSLLQKRANSPFPHLLMLFRPSVDWMRPS